MSSQLVREQLYIEQTAALANLNKANAEAKKLEDAQGGDAPKARFWHRIAAHRAVYLQMISEELEETWDDNYDYE